MCVLLFEFKTVSVNFFGLTWLTLGITMIPTGVFFAHLRVAIHSYQRNQQKGHVYWVPMCQHRQWRCWCHFCWSLSGFFWGNLIRRCSQDFHLESGYLIFRWWFGTCFFVRPKFCIDDPIFSDDLIVFRQKSPTEKCVSKWILTSLLTKVCSDLFWNPAWLAIYVYCIP